MAPPNGRAVLVFRGRCGCSIGTMEVPGPRKTGKDSIKACVAGGEALASVESIDTCELRRAIRLSSLRNNSPDLSNYKGKVLMDLFLGSKSSTILASARSDRSAAQPALVSQRRSPWRRPRRMVKDLLISIIPIAGSKSIIVG
ncbi:hypothetical protein HAX54_005395, partial [Datura stramonium]|nr:hypothetical protein [Datura stramonium]